jgi:hypothetical protein
MVRPDYYATCYTTVDINMCMMSCLRSKWEYDWLLQWAAQCRYARPGTKLSWRHCLRAINFNRGNFPLFNFLLFSSPLFILIIYSYHLISDVGSHFLEEHKDTRKLQEAFRRAQKQAKEATTV